MAQDTPGNTPANVAHLRGKVTGTRSFDRADGSRCIVTVLRLAGADEYGSGGAVEVEAQSALGAIGVVVSCKATIGGSIRPFKFTDKTTGELRKGTEARVRFTQQAA